LPDQPDLARFIATLFQRLGGMLEIDRSGRRHARRPDEMQLRREGLPQLAEAGPDERFHSRAGGGGAVKLAEYWLNRLSAADREYVFTLLAPTAVDPLDRFDFRKHV